MALVTKPTTKSRVYNQKSLETLGFQCYLWQHRPQIMMELLLRTQSGRHYPWPTSFDQTVKIASPLNNMMRRCSKIPVFPTQSWWNDLQGLPTGLEDPDSKFQATEHSDDVSFPANESTSFCASIQEFNRIHEDASERVTIFDLVLFLTQNEPQLRDITSLATSPTTKEQSNANKIRLDNWNNDYSESILVNGTNQLFSNRQNDFSYADVAAALKEVASLTPQILAIIENQELNDKKKKVKRKTKSKKTKAKKTTMKTTAKTEESSTSSNSGSGRQNSSNSSSSDNGNGNGKRKKKTKRKEKKKKIKKKIIPKTKQFEDTSTTDRKGGKGGKDGNNTGGNPNSKRSRRR